MTSPSESKLSAQELRLYDRQLRAWGHDVQERLSRARILFLRTNGVLSEVLKNLVLSGVGYIGISNEDSRRVDRFDCESSLFCRWEDEDREVGESVVERVKELNPYVRVELVTSTSEVHADVVVGGWREDREWLSPISTSQRRVFLLDHEADVGFCFVSQSEKAADTALKAAQSARNAHVKRFLGSVLTEGSNKIRAPNVAVSAVLGGVVAQEVQKAVTGSAEVLGNCIVADMLDEMLVVVEDVG